MAIAIGDIKPGFVADAKGNGTLIPIPPPNGGAVGWGGVYISFGVDFEDIALRIAIYNATSKAWRVTDSLPVPAAGPRVSVTLQAGDQKVSVGRVKTGTGDDGTAPAGYLVEAVLAA